MASETDYSDSVPQGYVISTNPTAGTEWAEGNTVTMVVSMGKEKISVPNVSGVDPDSAQTTLQGVGLTLGSESSSEYSDEYEEGTIIRTVPADCRSTDSLRSDKKSGRSKAFRIRSDSECDRIL